MKKKSRNKTAKAKAVELSESQLGEVAGGYAVKLENAYVTSYTISGSGIDDGESADLNLSSSPAKR